MTPWDGKRDFRGDTTIRVLYRCGEWSKQALPAHKWRGKWRDPVPHPYEYDIVGVMAA
jgi:hypothetical protein